MKEPILTMKILSEGKSGNEDLIKVILTEGG